mmetsp:Transcript_12564/g.41951  ORF Transcript_12564/g.41951 Transcript_12564/m.41951 type:complete len:221 (+) Transcript_12564:615-1277(+)
MAVPRCNFLKVLPQSGHAGASLGRDRAELPAPRVPPPVRGSLGAEPHAARVWRVFRECGAELVGAAERGGVRSKGLVRCDDVRIAAELGKLNPAVSRVRHAVDDDQSVRRGGADAGNDASNVVDQSGDVGRVRHRNDFRLRVDELPQRRQRQLASHRVHLPFADFARGPGEAVCVVGGFANDHVVARRNPRYSSSLREAEEHAARVLANGHGFAAAEPVG